MLADPSAFDDGSVGHGVVADPAFVDGLAGALVAGVGRDAEAVGLVVEPTMNKSHAEGDEVAGFPVGGGEPAASDFFAKGDGVFAEVAGMAPAVVD